MSFGLTDIRTTVLSYIPYDKGFMYANGTRFSETNTMYSIMYDGNAVPYIPYTEYKWISPKWNGKKNPNEAWIRNDTVNALDFLINQATSRQRSLIMATNKRTVQARNNQLSQGTLTQLKGYGNRGGKNVYI